MPFLNMQNAALVVKCFMHTFTIFCNYDNWVLINEAHIIANAKNYYSWHSALYRKLAKMLSLWLILLPHYMVTYYVQGLYIERLYPSTLWFLIPMQYYIIAYNIDQASKRLSKMVSNSATHKSFQELTHRSAFTSYEQYKYIHNAASFLHALKVCENQWS